MTDDLLNRRFNQVGRGLCRLDEPPKLTGWGKLMLVIVAIAAACWMLFS